jgi:GntR family transcriptional regulator/MocR family aminotransferase
MRTAPGIVALVSVDRRSRAPLHRQIYQGYRDAIASRRLRAGQRLPSTRSLAKDLGISRVPVLQAFDQLVAEGYCESHLGSGTFVARSIADPPASGAKAQPPSAGYGPRRLSPNARALMRRGPEPWLGGWGAFRLSQPAVDQLPFPLWARLVARHSRNPVRKDLGYAGAMGHRPFREAVAAYLGAARAVRCNADNIMVVSGSQQALDLCARVLLDPGSEVWVEEPGYSGARDALAMADARLVPVPVDEEGLVVAAGIEGCPRARAVYVTPSHQYPLGSTMSASRRLQLLEWARKAGAWVLEDDYDSEYRYDSLPIASLQGLDGDGRVVYVGTFSKVLFPAVRIGYIVIPADLVPAFVAVREAMDVFPPALPQAVLADFIGEGHFAFHLRRMRALYRERRQVLVEALEKQFGSMVEVVGGPAGLHVVARLRGIRDRPLALEAARQLLWVMPLSACYHGSATQQGLVLGYGGVGESEIARAVKRLRSLVPGR